FAAFGGRAHPTCPGRPPGCQTGSRRAVPSTPLRPVSSPRVSPLTDDSAATLAHEMMPPAPQDVPDAVPARPAAELDPATGVSIVVCVLNEERHVEEAVRHALTQDHLGPLELVIALGPSRDRTD